MGAQKRGEHSGRGDDNRPQAGYVVRGFSPETGWCRSLGAIVAPASTMLPALRRP